MLGENHKTELNKTLFLKTQIKLIRRSPRKWRHFDKRKNTWFVFFQHNCKYTSFYQANEILYPQRPCLVNLSLYRHIFEQRFIKGFCGLNQSKLNIYR